MLFISDLLINEQIRAKEVRLLSPEGEQLGIVSGKEAQAKADELQLDLCLISPKANPPVAKIMDYSKFKFDQAKKAKEARKKQKVVDVKEIRFSPNIDKHDLETKAKRAKEFLKHGDKVKVTMRFRGRELGYVKNASQILTDFAEMVSEYGTVEKAPKLESRNMFMFIAAKTDKK